MPDPLHDTWVRHATQGDEEAIHNLLELHLPALLAYVRLHASSLLRSRESCADLVQSVCCDVLAELDGFEFQGLAAFRKWLFLKARHKLVDRERFHRAQKRDPAREIRPLRFSGSMRIEAIYSGLLTPSRVAISHERIARFEAAFERLPADYQQVITLSRLCGMGHAEIAAEMGRSVGAVRHLLHRALARLGGLLHERRCLGETEG